MRRSLAVPMFALALATLSMGPVYAQGGGDRRRGMDESTLTKTSFESADKTLAFAVPPDVTLFTPDSPGRFGQVFKSGYMAYLINLVGGEVTIGIKAMPGATQADLDGLKHTLDTNPPQAKQPGYKKVSLGNVKIDTKQDKNAIDYVYVSENAKNQPITTRQIMFVHAGQGYVITCTAPDKEFASANKKIFDNLLEKLDLR